MKRMLFILFVITIKFTSTFAQGRKCYGYDNCTACTTCSACQYCAKGGGTCGVCSSSKHTPAKTTKKKTPTIEYKTIPSNNSPSNTIKSTSDDKDIFIVTASSLNLRSGPGVSFAIIISLEFGTEIIALTSNGIWWKVRVVNSGLVGYVHSSFIKRKP